LLSNLCTSAPQPQVLCRLVVNYDEMVTKEHALLNRIQAVTGEEERATLAEKSRKQKYTATLLPIRTVGVQVILTPQFFVYDPSYRVILLTVPP